MVYMSVRACTSAQQFSVSEIWGCSFENRAPIDTAPYRRTPEYSALTNIMDQSRWEANTPQQVEAVNETCIFIAMFNRVFQLPHILSQMNPIHAMCRSHTF